MTRLSDFIASTHKTCKYLNMMDDIVFKRSDFLNADGLNDAGASKLSIKVSKF